MDHIDDFIVSVACSGQFFEEFLLSEIFECDDSFCFFSIGAFFDGDFIETMFECLYFLFGGD